MTRALFIATIITWGGSWYAMRLQVGLAPVEVSICYRFGLATAVLGILLVLTGRLKRIPFETHRFLALMGFFLFGLNFFLFYTSAFYMATGIGSVIFTIAAIFNALNQWLFFGKTPERKVIAGSLLGTLGVLCLSSDQLASSGDRAWIGVLLALLATYIFSIGNVISIKVTASGIDLPNIVFRGMAWGTLGAGVAAIATGQSFVIPTAPSYWAGLLWLSIGASVVGFLCYLTLVNQLGAAKAAYVTVGVPPISLALSTLFENYQWHWIAAVGMAFILLGSFFVFAPGVRMGALRSSRAPARVA